MEPIRTILVQGNHTGSYNAIEDTWVRRNICYVMSTRAWFSLEQGCMGLNGAEWRWTGLKGAERGWKGLNGAERGCMGLSEWGWVFCLPGHAIQWGIVFTEAWHPLGHVVHRGMLSTKAYCPPGHVVHRGMLSTGAYCPPGHVVHWGMSFTGA